MLVYQDLFAGSDAGLSVHQQLELGGELKAAARKDFPIRVAIIASPFDLGAVTALWRKPRAYARFLGIELSAVYRQRFLVVMPDGLGFDWPGHATSPPTPCWPEFRFEGAPVACLMPPRRRSERWRRQSGIRLPSTTTPTGSAPAARASVTGDSAPAKGNSTDNLVGIVVMALAAIAIVIVAIRVVLRRRGLSLHWPARWRMRLPLRPRTLIPGATLVLVLVPITLLFMRQGSSAPSQAAALAANPELDPGTPIRGVAPDFTLSDQFGQPVSLRSFRGKVTILAFNDSECTTVCPLTTTAMMDAKAMLGTAGSRVQLLGVDANPAAISVEDVLVLFRAARDAPRLALPHRDPRPAQAGLEALRDRSGDPGGQITHTPALFVISPRGKLSRLYMTQMSYTAVPQLGQLLAQSASALLPGHPSCTPTCPTRACSRPRPAAHATLPASGRRNPRS